MLHGCTLRKKHEEMRHPKSTLSATRPEGTIPATRFDLDRWWIYDHLQPHAAD